MPTLLEELEADGPGTAQMTIDLLRCMGLDPALYKPCDEVDEEPDPDPDPDVLLRTYADNDKVRHCASLGVRTNGTSFIADQETFAQLWAETGMDMITADNPAAFNWLNDPLAARPGFTVKTTHRDLLVDDNRNPFTAGLDPRDFTSGHYNMGAPGQTDVLMDMLDAAAAHPLSPVITLVLSSTSSGQPRSVPDWLRNIPGAVFGTWPSAYLNMLNATVEQSERDLWYAVTQHYGNHPNVRFVRSEYFCQGNVSPEPGWTKNANSDVHLDIWTEIVDNMPQDANGHCAPFFQASAGNVSNAEVQASGAGIAFPDPDLFKNNCGNLVDGLCDPNSFQRKQQDGWPNVPVMHIGDGQKYLGLGGPATGNTFIVQWNGLPNPWGYVAGDSIPLTVDQAMWYHGSMGPIPVSDFYITTSQGVTAEDFSAAIGEFGPYGTQTAQWGVTPATP